MEPITTLAGALLGGIFRAVPEAMNYFDKKNERKHELDMQDKALAFQKLGGDQKIGEITAQGQQNWNVESLRALTEAIKTQNVEFRPTGNKYVDFLMAFVVFINATVRPVITYWFFGLYLFTKIAMFYGMITTQNLNWFEAAKVLWTDGDNALWAGILNFWFLGRVFEKVKTT